MERVELRTESRVIVGKKVKRLRAENWIPAVIYGHDMPVTAVKAQERSLVKVLQEAGSTALINLFVDNKRKPYLVLAREVQRDPLTSRLLHVDFYQVRLTEKVKTTPRLEFIGTSPAVATGMGVLVHVMTQLEVECLPTDLISSIPVDVSVLENLDDSIVVGDLPVPPEVTVMADPADVVASVVPVRAALKEEAEEAELAEGLEVELGELVEEEPEAEEEA